MKLRPHNKPAHSAHTARPAGFAMISAIFILVVLAALGAFGVGIASMQHMSSALDVESARILHVARSGLEVGAYHVTQNGECDSPSYNDTLPDTADTMQGITVTVTCSKSGMYYRLLSTACNQPSGGACPNTVNPSPTYVERQVEMTIVCDKDQLGTCPAP
ncbi:conserved exported protein of unknown function [Sterolibacterium denitrificans]|uniref:Agglutinin biogenesis protein MshP n=1 Tax=Sterolibacterium denitrificans TaxID=157592 RepID=A0A7Z7HQ71_9PROT|nr:agglutinin biogenesis protein MshP [Sterolibacterium denitrificans]SMB24373.1 conserved exported protein of unknown function [Sterolibacterium denitrificans]